MAPQTPLKVLSWNVNSVRTRLDRLLAVLARHRPHVVCLQELKCTNEHFPLQALKSHGYDCAVLGQKTYNGVAVCSLLPIDATRTPLRDETPHLPPASRIIGAHIAGIWFYSVYVPNGRDIATPHFQYKLDWMRSLQQYLCGSHERSDALALCGDFNVAPTDSDVHDPSLWNERLLCSTPERAALAALTGDHLTDTFRHREPKGGYFSWWDYRHLSFPLNKGLRIDLILATRDLVRRCTHASIDREERKGAKPSDHAPIIAEFSQH